MIVTQVMTPVNHANDLSHIFNLLSPLSPGSKIDTSHFHLDGILLFLTKIIVKSSKMQNAQHSFLLFLCA